ncbi:dickkopf-related protein 3a [Trichomycterus rosablanca]|uniref:dickkopf-related protein 3a n=1 Tax=Trichomycterus rosablanca TaxID=2290929 RepID=UPI002F352ED1
MLLFTLSFCLFTVHALLPDTATPVTVDLKTTTEPSLEQTPSVLSDMFNEEKRQEDIQLEDPEHQMDNESAKSSQSINNATSNYSNESSLESISGKQSVPAVEEINKSSDNAPTEIQATRTPDQVGSKENVTNNIAHDASEEIQPGSKENETVHACLIDEDCEKGLYCLYEAQHSECMPCKQSNVTCSKDEECCDDQLCVFGQCKKNVTKGEEGTICQKQSNCTPDLCCAFHKALLLPVCQSKPKEHERCIITGSHLQKLLSLDIYTNGPHEYCPCAGDLKCQHVSGSSLCLKGQTSSEEELTDTMYSEIDFIV